MSVELVRPDPFDGIGIDNGVAALVEADLSAAQALEKQAENAGIWVELVAEAAVKALGKSALLELPPRPLVEYLNEQLPTPAAQKLVAMVQDGLDSVIDPDGEFDSFGDARADAKKIYYTPKVLGEWARRRWQYAQAIDQLPYLHTQFQNPDLTASEEGAFVKALKRAEVLATAAYEWRQKLKVKGPDCETLLPDEAEFAITKDDWNAYPEDLPKLRRLLEVAQRSSAEKAKVKEIVDQLDKSEIEENRLKFGAKAANLMYLKKVFNALEEQGVKVLYGEDVIPDFNVVEAEAYSKWQADGNIDASVKHLYDWAKQHPLGTRYIARSSAVYSEDGSNTGPGVYDSIVLPENLTKDAIKAALTEIFGSVGTERAEAYREGKSVLYEKMGIVFQVVPEYTIGREAAYITVNTAQPGNHRLGLYREDVRLSPTQENRIQTLRIPLSRAGMFRELGSHSSKTYGDRFHVPIDVLKHRTRNSWASCRLAVLSELAFGYPVQIEALANTGPDGYDRYYCLQVRPVPREELKEEEFIGFPDVDTPPLFKGGGVGVLNAVRAVVKDGNEFVHRGVGSDGIGRLLTFENSYGQGGPAMLIETCLMNLPPEVRNKIIALVKYKAEDRGDGRGRGGHLETLFADLGIPLIFDDGSGNRVGRIEPGQMVELYSDGFEGRIYETTKR